MSSGVKYVQMSDGFKVRTAVVSTEDELAIHLPDFISGARNSGLFVGFDTEWMLRDTSGSRCAKIGLLKLCNNSGFCLLLELHRFGSMPPELIKLLAVRDITYVGVNISNELEKLKEDYGLEIRTTVDLSSVAAEKSEYSPFCYAGCIRLEGLGYLWEYTQRSKPKGVDEELIFWLAEYPWNQFRENCTEKQLEYAVYSAYAAVKIAYSLFLFHRGRPFGR
ncbi:hypothetical protein RND81_04G104700 [Saponaria officinalis]|uniref:3'-5' exonuclease domain-containing protein n=1 Tax=Saponaria officinalis TaxID=3572 RepID=A0AAW1LKT9_SAPOF